MACADIASYTQLKGSRRASSVLSDHADHRCYPMVPFRRLPFTISLSRRLVVLARLHVSLLNVLPLPLHLALVHTPFPNGSHSTYTRIYPVPDAICGGLEQAVARVSMIRRSTAGCGRSYICVAKAPTKMVPMNVVFLFTTTLFSVSVRDQWHVQGRRFDGLVDAREDARHLDEI